MAAYASAVTLYTPRVERISRNLGICAGKITISNYNSTTTEETTITRLFKASGVSGIEKGILSMSIVTVANGYLWGFDKSTGKFKVFRTATLTPVGTNQALTFTGTAPITDVNYATPAFSGTGLTAAGQVMTTTDNQTMTLNQCAGMWLLAATGTTPPMLIVSNTAVTGAPAVLTVIGAAATDAGAYKILKALTPIGTINTPTFTGTATTAAALGEVGDDVNVGAADFIAIGFIAA